MRRHDVGSGIVFVASVALWGLGCGSASPTPEAADAGADVGPEVACDALPPGAVRFPIDEGCFYTVRGEGDRPLACVCEVIPPAPFDAGPAFFDAMQEKTDDAACCWAGPPSAPIPGCLMRCETDAGAE